MHNAIIMPRVAKPDRLATRITAECRALINAMRDKWGQSEAAIVERAIREYAAKEGVTVPKQAGIAPAAVAEPKPAYQTETTGAERTNKG